MVLGRTRGNAQDQQTASAAIKRTRHAATVPLCARIGKSLLGPPSSVELALDFTEVVDNKPKATPS
jgi:hypothetical protein